MIFGKSKKERLLAALSTGEELTAAQISARFKTDYPHSYVRDLRAEGYPVYLNARYNSKGERKLKYRLGEPKRSLMAMGYSVLGAREYQSGM